MALNSQAMLGILDYFILQTLSQESMPGFAIAIRIEKFSRGLVKVHPATFLAALQRLEKAERLDVELPATNESGRARIYSITEVGRQWLDAERMRRSADLSRFVEEGGKLLTNFSTVKADSQN